MSRSSDDLTELQAQWASVRGKIRRKIGEALFKSWFKPLSLIRYESDVLILGVPNNFVRTRLIEEYHDLIKLTWKQHNKKIKSVEIVLTKNGSVKEENSKPREIKNKKQTPISPTISAELDLRFTFSNFIVGKPNELAFAAARRVAESQNVPFNPLFLYGGVGLGKTH